jgi:hypothetical protein
MVRVNGRDWDAVDYVMVWLRLGLWLWLSLGLRLGCVFDFG